MCNSTDNTLNGNPHRSNGTTGGNDADTPTSPARVAVIGCGPGGMFFLHALSERRRRLEALGDVQGLAALPRVTVMERNWAPGGVWCSDSSGGRGGTSASTNMYEGLWINASKEFFEFYDYTFDEHFKGRPVPAYLPRKDVLEYMMGRVTKSNPRLFEEVEFGTNVDSVEWNHACNEFLVTSTATRSNTMSSVTSRLREQGLKHSNSLEISDEEKKNIDSDVEDIMDEEDRPSDYRTRISQCRTFDKVIWAAGLNGRPNMLPTNVMDSLTNHFSGMVVHSSHINQQLDSTRTDVDGGSEDPVENKRILIIGDSYSAEDLVLQFVKLGAAKVYVSSRNGEGVAAPETTTSWPVSKNSEDGVTVETLLYTSITGGDSENEKRIWFDRTSTGINEGYPDEPIHVDGVDLIVLCTGYQANLDMIKDVSLKPWADKSAKEGQWNIPKDWKMKKTTLTELVGEDIEPSDSLGQSLFELHNFHRSVLIDNPNMMYIFEMTEFPLLDIDVKAHMCLNFLVEPQKYLPTQAEMEVNLMQQRIAGMNYPAVRYYIDSNYQEACDEISEDTWYYDMLTPQGREFIREWQVYGFLILARDMAESDYPLQLGTRIATIETDITGEGYGGRKVPTVTDEYELNENGEAMSDMNIANYYARYELEAHPEEERKWRTFRDDNPLVYRSIFTGTTAVPLPGKWLELDSEGKVSSK